MGISMLASAHNYAFSLSLSAFVDCSSCIPGLSSKPAGVNLNFQVCLSINHNVERLLVAYISFSPDI
jgi:hypothetical protein